MGTSLQLNHTKELTLQEKNQLDQHIAEMIEIHKNNGASINTLVMDSVTALSIAESRSEALADQGVLKSLWRGLTGKNQQIRADIDRNLATSQYAAGQMIQILAQQNLMSFDLVGKVNEKLNKMVHEVDGEINNIYKVLIDYFGQIHCYNEEQDEKIVELELQVSELKNIVRRMNMNCKNCGLEAKDGQLICYKCGEVLEVNTFADDNLHRAFLSKVEGISKVLKNNTLSTDYMWDVTVSKYAQVIESTKAVLSTELMADKVTTKMFRDMDNMLKRCKKAEFHIALVGAIKAGKSTLINAILGFELASTRVTPETAALTKFRSSKENYVKVSFYKAVEWDKLWTSAKNSRAEVFLEEYKALNADAEKNNWLDKETLTFSCASKEDLKEEIQKWTSSKSPTHYFVKEVEVGLEDFNMPEEVVFVDTPGLDDVVQYRSDITRDYIDRANAVLVCVKADALTGQEMATIYSVFANTRYNPEKVYIVATQLDTLNRPEENWKEQYKEWLKYLKRADCFGSERLASKNIIPVSGYFYTLIKNFDHITDQDDEYFDLVSILSKFRLTMAQLGENAKRLLEFTGVDILKRRLDQEVVMNYKSILIDDIRENFLLCKSDISDLMKKLKSNQQEVIETSEKGIEEIRAKREEYATRLEATAVDKKEMDKLLKTIKLATTKRVEELTVAIKSMGGVS
ncbi:dynamin family protein [Natranaerovirga pectinivora]|uniref:Dynamin family protein n=1 Tax=Natranaerovirga pectinivora TaxID=682400 RepID=A0A4R3MGS1_9FIRM|nr:dynamin family protein [Natranaerovirga pectinivora]TCT12840.1 dynamin family protein [Natranaerovirga pectinivora]